MEELVGSVDGTELSPEQAEHAWEPFFQGENHMTGEVPGTGLGLSTVSSIVWSQGGSCSIGNRTDRRGVVVEIVLPLLV